MRGDREINLTYITVTAESTLNAFTWQIHRIQSERSISNDVNTAFRLRRNMNINIKTICLPKCSLMFSLVLHLGA